MIKHIKIQEDVHKRLTSLGKKGETYSDIIMRLIDEAANKKE